MEMAYVKTIPPSCQNVLLSVWKEAALNDNHDTKLHHRTDMHQGSHARKARLLLDMPTTAAPCNRVRSE